MKFTTTIRYWNPEKGGGLAVADIPADRTAALGGLKQMRVRGTMNGAPYTSNVMPAGGGRLALSVSKALMKEAGVAVGDEVELEIERVPSA